VSEEASPLVEDASPPQGARQRLGQTLIVPILLLAAIGGWFWLGQTAAPVTGATPTAPSPVATPDATALVATAEAPAEAALLVGPATPWGAAGLEPTATPLPTAAPGVAAPGIIGVFGPPAGSRFRAADAVVFYWTWPQELAEGQRFVLYLVAAEGRRPLGQVDQANLGRAYQLRAPVGEAGDFRWEVVLEDGSTGAIIAASEPRAIITLDG